MAFFQLSMSLLVVSKDFVLGIFNGLPNNRNAEKLKKQAKDTSSNIAPYTYYTNDIYFFMRN